MQRRGAGHLKRVHVPVSAMAAAIYTSNIYSLLYFFGIIELLLLVMTTATCIHPVMEPTAPPTSPLT